MSRNVTYILAAFLLFGAAGAAVWGVRSESVHHQAAAVVTNIQPAVSTSTELVASSSVSSEATSSIATTAVASPDSAMRFEVVTTSAQQERGLGGRAVIPDNYAMLFVFPYDDTYGFWMKDMLVPIDMIWLSDTGTISKIDASVPVDSYPNAYYPPVAVKYVLETKAGFAAEHGWVVGTHVALPLPYGK